MQAQQTTSRPTVGYATFYKHCASYPELPKFRRLAAQFTKKLYDDVEELLRRERELDEAIAEYRVREGHAAITFLDCPRGIVNDVKLIEQWSEHGRLLRLYGKCFGHN